MISCSLFRAVVFLALHQTYQAVAGEPEKQELPKNEQAKKSGLLSELYKQYPRTSTIAYRVLLIPENGDMIPARIMGYVSENSTLVIFMAHFNPELLGNAAFKGENVRVYGRVWTCKTDSATKESIEKTIQSIPKEMIFDFFSIEMKDLDRNDGPNPPPAPPPQNRPKSKKDN